MGRDVPSDDRKVRLWVEVARALARPRQPPSRAPSGGDGHRRDGELAAE